MGGVSLAGFRLWAGNAKTPTPLFFLSFLPARGDTHHPPDSERKKRIYFSTAGFYSQSRLYRSIQNASGSEGRGFETLGRCKPRALSRGNRSDRHGNMHYQAEGGGIRCATLLCERDMCMHVTALTLLTAPCIG